jgi:hypothetical protein
MSPEDSWYIRSSPLCRAHNYCYSLFKLWSLASIFIIFKHSVPTSQKTLCVSIIESSRLILYREKIAVYFEDHMENTYKYIQQTWCRVFLMLNPVVHRITIVLDRNTPQFCTKPDQLFWIQCLVHSLHLHFSNGQCTSPQILLLSVPAPALRAGTRNCGHVYRFWSAPCLCCNLNEVWHSFRKR